MAQRVAPRRPRGNWLGAVTLVAALAPCATACQRKAPGPTECQSVAARLLGVTRVDQLRDPRVKDRFDSITVQCLLTPYDRRFIRCLEESGWVEGCVAEFHRRFPDAQRPLSQFAD